MLLSSANHSERNNWIELTVGLLVGIYYFTHLSNLPGSIETNPVEFVWFLVRVAIVAVILAVIAVIIISVGNKDMNENVDERDILIRQKSTVWSYWFLQFGIGVIVVQVIHNAVFKTDAGATDIGWFFEIPLLDLMFHTLMLVSLISQVLQNALEIFFQRRGY